MKPSIPLYLTLFPAISCCSIQMAVAAAEVKQSEPPAGPAYVTILEQVLAPSDRIDEWIRVHGMPRDATALRAEVQKWVEKKSATLDSTIVGVGTMGRVVRTEQIVEQIYPTDFKLAGGGVWPLPTEFEMRPIGYIAGFKGKVEGGTPRMWLNTELVNRLESRAWNVIADRTRHPDDVLFPNFVRWELAQGSAASQIAAGVDPFAEPTESNVTSMIDSSPSVGMEGIHLLVRLNHRSQEKNVAAQSRLVFARTGIEKAIQKTSGPSDDFTYSLTVVRIPHLDFSEWLQSRDPGSLSQEAWALADGLCKAGKGEVVESISSRGRHGTSNAVRDMVEVVYPTEWETPDKRTVVERWQENEKATIGNKEVDGVATKALVRIDATPGLAGAATPNAFESRPAGTTLEFKIIPDGEGLIGRVSWESVKHLGDSVHRRIEVDGEWIPDITMPLFLKSVLVSDCRLNAGNWNLLGALPQFGATGKVETEHALLLFLRVD